MKRETRKSGLSLWTAFRIGTNGMLSRPLRLIVVIFLSTVALSMFGLSLTVALYKEETAVVQSIYEYDDGTVVLRLDEDSVILPLTKAQADEIETGTGKAFALISEGAYLPSWMSFIPYTVFFSPEDYAVCMRTEPQSVCYATEEVIADAGFTLTGRLPQKKDEIAINGCMLQSFLRAGYYDNIASPQYQEDNRFVYDENCCYSVRSAQDLLDLNAKLYLTDPETGERLTATVVGVVEYGACPNGHEISVENLNFGLYDQVYVSEDFYRSVLNEAYGEDFCGFAAVAGKATSLSEARTVFDFCGANGYTLYSNAMQTVAEYREKITSCAETFAGIGAAFAVFAVLLIYQFVSLSIESKKLQIGVLRALGARASDVYQIFLSESIFLALISAALAVPLTIGLSKAANLILKYGFLISVTVLNFHWLMPVLLFVMSIGITLLTVLFPVIRMAKKSPVESIRLSN